jgi:outer membrane lipoprotein SlyB
MKVKIIAILMGLALSGCIDLNKRYTDNYLAANPKLHPKIKESILNKEFTLGMTEEQVIAAVGWMSMCGDCAGNVTGSFGKVRVINPNGNHYLWAGSSQYLYFDRKGKLIGWNQR